jgi:hypothetical protein
VNIVLNSAADESASGRLTIAMPKSEDGSLTKEPPLAKLDATLRLVEPGMAYRDLLELSREQTHRDAPGLLRSRVLLIGSDDRVVYDRFLSLMKAKGIESPLVRKVMYFTWSWRDERLRRFVCEQIVGADGRWHVPRLVDKDRAKFFERWFAPSSAVKARSNIEFFLTECGIYRPATSSIHLELEDGWLAEAMLVAAQHEPDRSLHYPMGADPIGVLRLLGLTALADLPPGAVGGATQAQRIADLAQVEADEESAPEYPRPGGAVWKVRERRPVVRQTITSIVDSVKLERANASHARLEEITASVLTRSRLVAHCSEAIDMYCVTAEGVVMFEMKSCHENNFHSQVRRGVSQLLEYRYLFERTLGNIVALVLLVEIAPPGPKDWLESYLRSVGITLVWVAKDGTAFTSHLPLPPALGQVVLGRRA